MKIKLN